MCNKNKNKFLIKKYYIKTYNLIMKISGLKIKKREKKNDSIFLLNANLYRV